MIPARELSFEKVDDSKAVRAFVTRYHYSGSCPPGNTYFAASHRGRMVGAAVYRKPSLPKTRAAYGVDLELSRLVMADECGKNSESRFVGFQLRWLKRHSSAVAVISFADPHHGHSGIIYRASNFTYLGREKGHGTRRIYIDGEELHSKTAYDRYGCSGAKLKDLLPDKRVEVVVRPPKHVYLFVLRPTMLRLPLVGDALPIDSEAAYTPDLPPL